MNKRTVLTYFILCWLLIPILILFKIQSFYLSIFFSLNIVQSFAFIVLYILHISDVLKYVTDNKNVQSLSMIGYVLGFILIYAFLQREHFIYYWDFSAYWNTSIQFNNLISTDFIAGLKQIYASILRDDYSVFPSVFLSLPLKILGTSYTSYVLSIYTCFLYPFSIIVCLLCIKISQALELNTRLNNFLIFLIAFSFPIAIAPMLGGYLDSIGLIFVSLSLIILFNSQFERLNLKSAFLIALALVVLTFTRRWYGFWIVSFFCSISLTYLIKWLLDKEFKFRQLLYVFINVFIIGLASGLSLVIFFNEFIRRSLMNNFQNAYSAYYFGDLLSNIKNMYYHYGLFIILIAIVGFIGMLLKKKTRYISLFLFFNVIISFFLFIRIQSFASQHYYLLTTNILILFTFGVILIISYSSKVKYLRLICSLIIIYLFMCNFLVTFTNINFKAVTAFGPILSDFKQTPRVRTDIQELNNLKDFLKNKTSENHKAYVVSSSGILNDDILRQIDMPEINNALPFLNLTHHVDLRDGFPDTFFTSDFIVVATPTQYHLDESGQKVIGVLASEVTSGSLKDHFKALRSFQLDNNVQAIVLQKISPITQGQINDISKIFKKSYPNNPDLF